MNFELDIASQIKRILFKFNLMSFDSVVALTNNTLADIYDGELYQKFLNSGNRELVRNGKCFTFTLNTDGISLCQKSKKSIWPIILVINELPLQVRFCLENSIIAGKILLQS